MIHWTVTQLRNLSRKVFAALVRSPTPGSPYPVLNVFEPSTFSQELQDEIVLTLVFVEQARRTEKTDSTKINGKESLQTIEASLDFVNNVLQMANATSGGDGGGWDCGDGGGESRRYELRLDRVTSR